MAKVYHVKLVRIMNPEITHQVFIDRMMENNRQNGGTGTVKITKNKEESKEVSGAGLFMRFHGRHFVWASLGLLDIIIETFGSDVRLMTPERKIRR